MRRSIVNKFLPVINKFASSIAIAKHRSSISHRTWERLAYLSQIFGTIIAFYFSYLAYSISSDALNITKEMAMIDRTYKDLSINPVITAIASFKDRSFYFKNVGLGPARVIRIVMQIGDRCLDSALSSDFGNDSVNFLFYFNDMMRLDVRLVQGQYNAGVDFGADLSNFLIGHFIKADQEWSFYKISKGFKSDASDFDQARLFKQWSTFVNFDFRYIIIYNGMHHDSPKSNARSYILPSCYIE